MQIGWVLLFRAIKVIMLAVVYGADHPGCDRVVVSRLANELEKYIKTLKGDD